ncbi:MAG: YbjN domain-containing protein [Bacteroidetes bacterium]|nr:YbjN domain-containing protein [Bacteroidota bacterium]MBU1719072.1 YbjN domain-containing protein [Bacteroidota bacterium]
MTNHLQQLKHLQELAQKIGFQASILEKSENSPLDVLSISVANDDDEEGYRLDLVFFPRNVDLEGAELLQFFYLYPHTFNETGLQNVVQILPLINNRMSLGHLSINHIENTVQFKYILPLPFDKEVDILFFKDVLEICMFSPTLFEKIIFDLATAQITVEEAKRQIIQAE